MAEEKTKLHINRDPDGRIYCPTCGHELGWDSSESQADRGMVPDEDCSSINYYSCQYCGASIEQIEANDEEKPIYPFWNDALKDKYEDKVSETRICPFCGNKMEMESEMCQEDVGNADAGNAMVYVYTCARCGSHVEEYECSDKEKPDYKFWKK